MYQRISQPQLLFQSLLGEGVVEQDAAGQGAVRIAVLLVTHDRAQLAGHRRQRIQLLLILLGGPPPPRLPCCAVRSLSPGYGVAGGKDNAGVTLNQKRAPGQWQGRSSTVSV